MNILFIFAFKGWAAIKFDGVFQFLIKPDVIVDAF